MRDDQLLMLAYYFPPIKSIGVVRNFNLANEFSKWLKEVHVITTSNRNILPAEAMPMAETIKIYQAFTFDYRNLMSLRQKKGSPHLTVAQKENWISQVLVKVLRGFPFNLLFGEGGFFYILNGVLKGRKIIRSSKNRTILYSSFPTYSDHQIAAILKRWYPSCYWIADFRDLHTDPIYKLVYWEKFQHWCNRRVLRNADLVTTVSRGLADQLSTYHDTVHVLMNGVKLKTHSLKEKSSSKFTITYTGSLFTDERDPTPLFKAIHLLLNEGTLDAQDVQFIYAGKDGAQMEQMIAQENLQSIFENKGLVSREEALDLQRRTHINLLLTSSHQNMSGVLTGKLFEYLAAENPILLLIKGTRDIEFEQIFEKLNAGHITYEGAAHQEKLKNYLAECYGIWKYKGKLDHQINRNELAKSYSWEKSMKDLWNCIDQSTQKSAHVF